MVEILDTSDWNEFLPQTGLFLICRVRRYVTHEELESRELLMDRFTMCNGYSENCEVKQNFRKLKQVFVGNCNKPSTCLWEMLGLCLWLKHFNRVSHHLEHSQLYSVIISYVYQNWHAGINKTLILSYWIAIVIWACKYLVPFFIDILNTNDILVLKIPQNF